MLRQNVFFNRFQFGTYVVIPFLIIIGLLVAGKAGGGGGASVELSPE